MSLALTVDLIGPIVAAIAAATAGASIIGASKAGVLKRVRLGGFEIEAASPEALAFREALEKSKQAPEREALPFEVEQLANYYAQILSQSKVSFWFSLIFASLGFLVIVVAAFLYNETSSGSAIAQFVAGIIMDAVAGLFFVQSKNAQKSMGDFFDKLRKDRAHVESRALCEAVTTQEAKDSLRVHLALFYAGVEGHENIANAISTACLSKKA
jgi:hypothetical protein